MLDWKVRLYGLETATSGLKAFDERELSQLKANRKWDYAVKIGL